MDLYKLPYSSLSSNKKQIKKTSSNVVLNNNVRTKITNEHKTLWLALSD